MAISYRPPGVLPVNELQTSPISPVLDTGQEIPCVVGEALGYQTYTEAIAPTGTTATTLLQRGIILSDSDQAQLSFTVFNPTTYETINAGNYIITQTAGTATGAETTTFKRIAYPGTFTVTAGTASGTVIPAGEYRYSVSYDLNIDTGGGTAEYESGLGSAMSLTVGSGVTQVELTNLPSGTAAAGAGITVTGRNVYRSKNLGTTNNPNWGPWYRLTGSGTTTVDDASTTSFTDDKADSTISAYPNQLPGIGDGDTITVQYNYADVEYYKPTLFTDFNDVISKYGEPFTSTGLISSKVSFGAKVAMVNGATRVVCQAVSGGDWASAITALEEDEDSTVVIPLSGSASVHSLVASHCTSMKQRNVFKTAVFGYDGVSGTVSATDLRTSAEGYNRNDIQVISPAIFRYYNSYLNREVEIGAQYVAPAVAGMRASRSPADSLSRQVLAGFSSIGEKRSSVAMNSDAASGLFVVEQKGGVMRVRHDISTAPADVNTREFPVILQKYNMIRGILDVYDQGVIGKLKATQESLGAIQAMTSNYLSSLVNSGELGSYNGVSARFSTSDPTLVDVKWSYRPIYTIHYVSITIGLSLSTGNTTISSIGGNANNGNILL